MSNYKKDMLQTTLKLNCAFVELEYVESPFSNNFWDFNDSWNAMQIPAWDRSGAKHDHSSGILRFHKTSVAII